MKRFLPWLSLESPATTPTLETVAVPACWEQILFRLLNAAMSVFFLLATARQQTDDNACLWLPVFLGPALLSGAAAARPRLTEKVGWKAAVVIHTALSFLLALVWAVQLLRTVQEQSTDILTFCTLNL